MTSSRRVMACPDKIKRGQSSSKVSPRIFCSWHNVTDPTCAQLYHAWLSELEKTTHMNMEIGKGGQIHPQNQVPTPNNWDCVFGPHTLVHQCSTMVRIVLKRHGWLLGKRATPQHYKLHSSQDGLNAREYIRQGGKKLDTNERELSSKRTRQRNSRYLFVRNMQKRQHITIEYCPTDEMIGDFFFHKACRRSQAPTLL